MMVKLWKTATGVRKYRKVQILEVCIVTGHLAKDFIKRHPALIRTIQICLDQTLADLHQAIFKAFGRWENHFYEFQFGKGPHDPKAVRYVLPSVFKVEDVGENKPAESVISTTIGSLDLKFGQSFGYWFDFGDNWYHQINVRSTGLARKGVRYPWVSSRIGPKPPQYPKEDDEDS